MNIPLRHRFFVIVGLLVCVHVACNSSAETPNDKGAIRVEVQASPAAEAQKEKPQEAPPKPITLSEEQYRQWVADFTSGEKKFIGKKPCVVDFYADWCRPCRILAPTFEKMAEKYGNKVNFYKVNVDYCKSLSAAYNITNIPTLFFYDKKGTLSRMLGVPSEEELENAIGTIMQ